MRIFFFFYLPVCASYREEEEEGPKIASPPSSPPTDKGALRCPLMSPKRRRGIFYSVEGERSLIAVSPSPGEEGRERRIRW